ncbi:MAG: hypothetical protein U1C57_03555 [Candidatus Doudnabacteria bacterium]|nr:hypothetical protein [Candidatus Doudnabacteria bacterium]
MSELDELFGSVAAALGGGFSKLWVILHVDRDSLPEGLDSRVTVLALKLKFGFKERSDGDDERSV